MLCFCIARSKDEVILTSLNDKYRVMVVGTCLKRTVTALLALLHHEDKIRARAVSSEPTDLYFLQRTRDFMWRSRIDVGGVSSFVQLLTEGDKLIHKMQGDI